LQTWHLFLIRRTTLHDYCIFDSFQHFFPALALLTPLVSYILYFFISVPPAPPVNFSCLLKDFEVSYCRWEHDHSEYIGDGDYRDHLAYLVTYNSTNWFVTDFLTAKNLKSWSSRTFLKYR